MQHSGIFGWRWTRTTWLVVACAIGLVAPAVYGQKDMGAGWCGKHGNYTGSSCPSCAAESSSSSDDSRPYTGPNLWRTLRHMKEKREDKRLADAYEANEQGLAYWNKGDWANAVPCFEKAAKKSPSDPVIQKNLAYAQARLADEQTRRANEKVRLANEQAQLRIQQQDKAAAANMQQAITSFAQTMNTAPAIKGGLSFGETAGEKPSSNGGLDFLPGDSNVAQQAGSPATAQLEFGDTLAKGAFGSNESNARFATVEARTPGSNTTAGDQLKSAAASGDLKINFDVGGAPGAGSLVAAHTVSAGPPPPMDLSRFSERARKDPEIVVSLNRLSELQSKRIELDTQRTALTNERNLAKDADAMKKLTEQLAKKENDYQANLAAITEKTEQIEKRHRLIDNTVEVSAK